MDKLTPTGESRDESVLDKLQREAYVVGEGLRQGFQHGFNETVDGGLNSALHLGGSAALGLALGFAQSRAGILRLGAEAVGTAMGVAFFKDVLDPGRFSNIGTTLSAAWESKDNTQTSIKSLKENLGQFAFDTTAGMVLTGGGMVGGKYLGMWSAGAFAAGASSSRALSGLPSMRDNTPLSSMLPTLELAQMDAVAMRAPKKDAVRSDSKDVSVERLADKISDAASVPVHMTMFADPVLARELAVQLKPDIEAMHSREMISSYVSVRRLTRNETVREAELVNQLVDKAPKNLLEDFLVNDWSDVAASRKLLADHPQSLKVYEAYTTREAANQAQIAAFDKQLGTHVQSMEDKVNVMLAEKGRPPVKMQMVPDQELPNVLANYRASQNTVSIRRSHLMEDMFPEQVVSTVGHEVTHHDQIARVAHLWLDQVGAGKKLTDAQWKAFRQINAERLPGSLLRDEFVRDVLRYRKGQPLPEAEASQAKAIQEAWGHNTIGTSGKLEKAKQSIDEHILLLKTPPKAGEPVPPAHLMMLNHNLFHDRNWTRGFRRIYGKDEPPPVVRELMTQVRRISDGELPASSWDEAAAKVKLLKILTVENARLDAERAALESRYRNQPHETEAFHVTRLVRDAAKEVFDRGVPKLVKDMNDLEFGEFMRTVLGRRGEQSMD